MADVSSPTTGAFDLVPIGPEQAAHNRMTGRRRWAIGALIAQLFLLSFYAAVLTADDLSPAAKVGALVLLLAFSACYVWFPGRVMQAPLGRRIAVVGALFLLTIPMFWVTGTATSAMWIFVAVAGGMLFAAEVAMALGAALAALMLVVDLVAGDPLSWELALTLIALTAFVVGFAGNVRLTIELQATREQLAVAAVAAERERIGRDLHDILGHSLTAIAVKAGLARRLVGRDDAGAAAEIGDVERLAREALTDVRATASGFREVSLAAELAVAATVLRAAGIRAVLPGAVDAVDPAARQLFGYVVREAVTNVVRHSHARTCRVIVTADTIEIIDDGTALDPAAAPGPTGDGPIGIGLRGLADRVAAAGGRLDAGPLPGGGFRIAATLHPAVRRESGGADGETRGLPAETVREPGD